MLSSFWAPSLSSLASGFSPFSWKPLGTSWAVLRAPYFLSSVSPSYTKHPVVYCVQLCAVSPDWCRCLALQTWMAGWSNPFTFNQGIKILAHILPDWFLEYVHGYARVCKHTHTLNKGDLCCFINLIFTLNDKMVDIFLWHYNRSTSLYLVAT